MTTDMKWESVFPRICESMFRLTATSQAGKVSATCFPVGRFNQEGKLEFSVATAKHVFTPVPLYIDVEWKFERFNWKGVSTGVLTFTSNISKTKDSPVRTYNNSDVGLLVLPKLSFEVKPVKVINPDCLIGPGAKVGWAGFPEFVIQKTGSPHPCYFEGVISTVVDRIETEGKLFYLVDGHGGRGVSGGPLWCWDDELQDYLVIGICSQYLIPASNKSGSSLSEEELALANQLPGLVVFESINPVVGYMQTWENFDMEVFPKPNA